MGRCGGITHLPVFILFKGGHKTMLDELRLFLYEDDVDVVAQEAISGKAIKNNIKKAVRSLWDKIIEIIENIYRGFIDKIRKLTFAYRIEIPKKDHEILYKVQTDILPKIAQISMLIDQNWNMHLSNGDNPDAWLSQQHQAMITQVLDYIQEEIFKFETIHNNEKLKRDYDFQGKKDQYSVNPSTRKPIVSRKLEYMNNMDSYYEEDYRVIKQLTTQVEASVASIRGVAISVKIFLSRNDHENGADKMREFGVYCNKTVLIIGKLTRLLNDICYSNHTRSMFEQITTKENRAKITPLGSEIANPIAREALFDRFDPVENMSFDLYEIANETDTKTIKYLQKSLQLRSKLKEAKKTINRYKHKKNLTLEDIEDIILNLEISIDALTIFKREVIAIPENSIADKYIDIITSFILLGVSIISTVHNCYMNFPFGAATGIAEMLISKSEKATDKYRAIMKELTTNQQVGLSVLNGVVGAMGKSQVTKKFMPWLTNTGRTEMYDGYELNFRKVGMLKTIDSTLSDLKLCMQTAQDFKKLIQADTKKVIKSNVTGITPARENPFTNPSADAIMNN